MVNKVLFVGDSITDAGRIYDNPTDMGRGYPLLIKASLGLDNTELEFINRGINGNRIVDLYARIKKDIINLKPDIVSIYVGVNDVRYDVEGQYGVDTPKFIKIYKMLIDEIIESLPNVKIMLITPFLLEGRSTRNIEACPDRFERLKSGVLEKALAVKNIAAEYGLPFVELQPVFDKVSGTRSVEKITVDGVHPTPEGHEIIKRIWVETFQKLEKG